MKRSSHRLAALLILVFGSAACSSPGDNTEAANIIKFTDDLGRVVELSKRPERIISLAPNITEIVFFLGSGEKLIGVTSYCDWPPQAREIPRVGDFSHPSIERIVELSPDLVLTTSHEQDRWIGKLFSLGIPVYSVYPHDCEALLNSMENLLGLLGDTPAGLDSIRIMAEKLAKLGKTFHLEGNERPGVFIEISKSPLMTAGSSSFVSDLIERAGGRNIASGLPRDYCVINAERVIKSDPDIVFLFHGLSKKEELSRRIGWGSIGAVKKGRVYDDIDPDIVLRPGPRAVLGIKEIGERLREGN